MKFATITSAALLASALSAAVPASAAIITLDFEGVGDLIPVGSFYAALGVEFSPATLAIVDSDAGGSGNIANEPSGDTVMFFLDANNAILNFAAGFKTGFSFFYATSVNAVVSVWDGLDGTGNLLGSINIIRNIGGPGDPTGSYATWDIGGIAFAGTAKSIDFGGTANFTGYDDITFGSATPVPPIPLPAALPLLLGALAVLGTLRRRRRAV